MEESKEEIDMFDEILKGIAGTDALNKLKETIAMSLRVIHNQYVDNKDYKAFEKRYNAVQDAIKRNKKRFGRAGKVNAINIDDPNTGRSKKIQAILNAIPKIPKTARSKAKTMETKVKEALDPMNLNDRIKKRLKNAKLKKDALTEAKVSDIIKVELEIEGLKNAERIVNSLKTASINSFISSSLTGRVNMIANLINYPPSPDIDDEGDDDKKEFDEPSTPKEEQITELMPTPKRVSDTIKSVILRYLKNPDKIIKDFRMIKKGYDMVDTLFKVIQYLGGISAVMYMLGEYLIAGFDLTVDAIISIVQSIFPDEDPAEIERQVRLGFDALEKIPHGQPASPEEIADVIFGANRSKSVGSQIEVSDAEYDDFIKKINAVYVDGRLDISGIKITDKPKSKQLIGAPGDDVDISGVKVKDPIGINLQGDKSKAVVKFKPKPGQVPPLTGKTDNIQVPVDGEDVLVDVLQGSEYDVPSKPPGGSIVRTAIQNGIQSGATLEQALRDIKEKNDEPGYDGDMYLRPEFKTIWRDIEKLKWMDTPEQKREEELAIMDIVYVDEKADPRTHGELVDSTDNPIVDINKAEVEFRYKNARLTNEIWEKPGFHCSVRLLNNPEPDRINPDKTSLYANELTPHYMFAGQLAPRMESSDTLNLLPKDDMSTQIIVDENLMLNPMYRHIRAR
jgi:hypothetical protein